MLTFAWFLIIPFVFYCALIAIGVAAWRKYPYYRSEAPVSPFISVIVAARNEENNLPGLLNDLLRQDYPQNCFEVLIADDHSTDRTQQLILDFARLHPNIKLVSLSVNEQGKKAALNVAVKKALSEFIVSTDADCRLLPGWLSTLAAFYNDYKPDLLIGPVKYSDSTNFWKQLQALEFTSLTGSAACSASAGFPVMCNAANLGFCKSLYYEACELSLSNYSSGDDMGLLLAARRNANRKINFLKSKDALVSTSASPGFTDFVCQRMRWVSKSLGYKDASIILVALLVLLVCVLQITSVALWAMGYLGWLWPLALNLIKWFADFFFFITVLPFFRQKKLLLYFIPCQLIYPFYVTGVALAGIVLPVSWKGRLRSR